MIAGYDHPDECSLEKDCGDIDWRFSSLSGSHHTESIAIFLVYKR